MIRFGHIYRWSILTAALMPLLIAGTDALAAKKVEETLATVNGDAIYLSDYESNAKNVLDDLRKTMPQEISRDQSSDIRKKVLDQMIDDLLLLQEAQKLKVRVYDKDTKAGVDEIKTRFRRDEQGRLLSEEEADAAFQVELKRQRLSYSDFEERIRKQLMVIKLVDQNIKSKVAPPNEKEAREFFKKVDSVIAASKTAKETQVSTAAAAKAGIGGEDREEIAKLAQLMKDRTSERVRARHILIKFPPNASMADKSKALAEIRKVKLDLDKGSDFAELAKEKSQDTESARKGGDLGYFIRGWMVPAFEKTAFSSPVGEIAGPVETEFGYHLILVEEKRAPVALRFDDVEEDLGNYLMQRNFQKSLREYVAGLRAKAEIQIKDQLLSSEMDKKGGKGKEGKP